MARPHRVLQSGCPFYVTSVTYHREPIFEDPRMCRLLVATLQVTKAFLDFRQYSYVVMPDHLHSIIQPTRETGLSETMRYIKGEFARKYNRLMGRKGRVWQEGFYDTGLRTPHDVLTRIQYTHRNPWRAGLEEEFGAYEFSSYHIYKAKAPNYLIDMVLF